MKARHERVPGFPDEEGKGSVRGRLWLACVLTVLGLLTGSCVSSLLDHFKGAGWKYSLDKLVFDINTMAYRNVPPRTVQAGFTLLEIDQGTYAAWGEPPLAPRDRLAELVRLAVESGAAAVVLDMKLSKQTDRDEVLRSYLAGLRDPDGPPILLVREFAGTGHCGVAAPTPYDAVVEASPQVFWTSTRLIGPANGPLHRQKSWERSCEPEAGEGAGKAAPVPFVSLAVAALIPKAEDGTAASALQHLREELASVLDGTAHEASGCGPADAHGHAPALCLANGRRIPLDDRPSTADTLIRFTLPWTLREGESRPVDRRSGMSILERIPAHMLTAQDRRAGDILRDRIVLIGSTHGDSGDIVLTPFGLMPGVHALINAIHSQVNLAPLHHLDHASALVIEFLIALLASLLIVFLPQTALSSLIGSGVLATIFIVLIPAGAIYCWGDGVWVDVLSPPVSAFLHHKLIHWIIHRVRHSRPRVGRSIDVLPPLLPRHDTVPAPAGRQKEEVE